MTRRDRIPDFFVIGAPKCGTTALCSYFEDHPGIFMSPVKEPHYFYTDIASRSRINAADYSRLFAKAGGDQLCGEGSTLYLFSRYAVTEILEANPKAKLIAMVRNPLEMVVSFHGQKVYAFEENEPDFAVAWRLSDARASGHDVPPGCRAPEELNYKSVGRLGEQIERLLRTARAEQVHIIVFDDFVSNTAATYRGTLQFLGLSDPGTREFPVINAHKEHRLPWVSKFLMQPPFPVRQIKSLLKQRFPAQVKRTGKLVYGINKQPAAKPAVAIELRRQMAREFADDIELLGSLLGKDLSHWYKEAL
jgi:Sulfotransferase domain